MLRFWYVIIISLPYIIYYLAKGSYIEKNTERYSEADRYRVALHVIHVMKRNGRIRTSVTGVENLPAEGGYVLYANHQGKYDALGIMDAHKPCTVMMDAKRSKMIIVDQFITLIDGCRIDKTDIKSQVEAVRKVTKEVKKADGTLYFQRAGISITGMRSRNSCRGHLNVQCVRIVRLFPCYW